MPPIDQETDTPNNTKNKDFIGKQKRHRLRCL